jgi:hypothetical protein
MVLQQRRVLSMLNEIIRIDCYLSLDCQSEQGLRERIKEAVQREAVRAEVFFTRVTESEAADLGLRGSPSVLVDGEDMFPTNLSGFS